MIQIQSPPSVPSLFEKRKTTAKKIDANLIQVAPEHWDTSGLACLYRGAFNRKCILSEVLKESVKKKMLGMRVP
jgi:hypothetical protein